MATQPDVSRRRVFVLLGGVVVAQAVANASFVLGWRLTVALPAVVVSLVLLAGAMRSGATRPGPRPLPERRVRPMALAPVTPLRGRRAVPVHATGGRAAAHHDRRAS